MFLRKKPNLSVIFRESELEFMNAEYHDENGIYQYDQIIDFHYESRDVSITLSAVSAILQLTGFDATRFPLRPIPNITFEYQGENQRITFNDCDQGCVDDFLAEISSRLNTNSST